MKDIKIRITDKAYNLAIIEHAISLGYPVNQKTAMNLLDADYLILYPNKAVQWCEKAIFDTALNYEEMTDVEFFNYEGDK